METPKMLWAYLGPETTLPLVSVLGALIGVLLMFWHFFVGCVKKVFRMFFKRGSIIPATDAPQNPGVQGHPMAEGTAVRAEKEVNDPRESAV
jgi:hypothetical protein